MKFTFYLFFIILFGPLWTKAQATSQTSDLKVLSWNIHMLPSVIYSKTKKKIRSREIVKELSNTDYNIIVLQEAFHSKARRRLKKGLKEKYPFAYGPANKKFLSIKGNSGLLILSDRPLILKGQVTFDECSGPSCMARKGAMLVEGDHYGHIFQLINTHTNGGPLNNYQFHLIREKLLDPYKKGEVPQIICGDFNTRKNSPDDQYNAMLRIFGVEQEFRQFDDRSKVHKEERKVDDIYTAWPDFIFVKGNANNLINIKRIATVSLGPVWGRGSKKVYLKTVGLSDHYPVKIELNWSGTQLIPTTSIY